LIHFSNHTARLYQKGDLSAFWREGSLVQGLMFFWLLAIVASSQILAGGSRSEFYHPDEPAHFVTGVMVHEYLRSGNLAHPVEFAEDFYLRYPKVAFGHWPPLFYLIQGLWYFPFGVSKASALTLVGALALATACCLYAWLQSRTSRLAALLATSLFLILPLSRLHSTRVSSEMLVEFFCLLGMMSLVMALENGSWRRWGCYVLCVALGLLTKETALPLFLCLPLAIVMSGRLDLLRSGKLVTALGIAAFALVALARWKMNNENGWHGMRSFEQLGRWIGSNANLSNSIAGHLELAHPLVLFVALLSVIQCVIATFTGSASASSQVLCAVATAGILASLAFGWLLGSFETRYLMPAMMPLSLLFAIGLGNIFRSIGRRSKPLGYCVVTSLGLASICLSMKPLPSRTLGFSAVAKTIDAPVNPTVILVSSDSSGEGSFIVERMLHDEHRSAIVLRASKVLGGSDWSGEGYRLVYETDAEMLDFLLTFPVHFIVYDHQAWRNAEPERHHRMLLEILRSDPARFDEVKRFPLTRGGQRVDDAISIFKNHTPTSHLHPIAERSVQHSSARLRIENTVILRPSLAPSVAYKNNG
jgi:hypothetical protein